MKAAIYNRTKRPFFSAAADPTHILCLACPPNYVELPQKLGAVSQHVSKLVKIFPLMTTPDLSARHLSLSNTPLCGQARHTPTLKPFHATEHTSRQKPRLSLITLVLNNVSEINTYFIFN
jgi:hypothetical protein